DWKKLLAVQRSPVQIGVAAKSAQTQLLKRAVEFMQRGFDGGRRQSKHAGESLRIAAAKTRQLIVGDSRDCNGVVRLKTVRARWRNAEDLPVDPEPVHMLASALNL